MPTTISPKVFQARINLGGTFGNLPEPTTPTTLWLMGGLKNNEDWRSEMEKEESKVFRFLIGMADADMENAYDAYMWSVERP